MSDGLSRRDLFRGAAALIAIEPALAQHVHQAVEAEKQASGAYTPKLFTAHEYRTLVRLADLIIPPDQETIGGAAAGAPEFIDLLCSRNQDLALIYSGGLAWLDHESERRFGSVFADATPDRQSALLDLIAFRKNDTPEFRPGIRFFAWARKMVVDAFFTSKAGIEYLGYRGNGALAKFEVPAGVLEYALKRSPV